ncbi:hypothetical protein M0R45_031134 [Rubus argutus]|uniref:Uncharacterized protein n=1 Tax=Rubus argutus TaxID=59490 RepID=A0AAW1WDE1_RUBAR
MGPKRGGLPPPVQHAQSPPQPPPPSLSQFPPLPSSNSPPLRHHQDTNPLQMDLQLHRDQTSATFQELRETMEQMRSQNSTLRSELLDELRQLRIGPKRPVEPSSRSESSSPKSSSSPPPASVHPPVSLTSAANGNFSSGFPDLSVLPLYHSFVTGTMSSNTHQGPLVYLGVSSGGSSMVTLPVFSMDGMGLSSGAVAMPIGPQYLSAPQYSHMPGFGLQSQPLLVSQPQIEPNSFNFTYSGPYPVSYIDCNPPPTQLCSQALPYIPLPSHLRSKQQSSIPLPSTPTYSVTTTQYPQRHFPSMTHPCSPHSQIQSATGSPEYPHSQFPLPQVPCPNDPQLPTMKQMRLDFPIFSGGDPVEWLNKAEQYFALYQIPEDRKN